MLWSVCFVLQLAVSLVQGQSFLLEMLLGGDDKCRKYEAATECIAAGDDENICAWVAEMGEHEDCAIPYGCDEVEEESCGRCFDVKRGYPMSSYDCEEFADRYKYHDLVVYCDAGAVPEYSQYFCPNASEAYDSTNRLKCNETMCRSAFDTCGEDVDCNEVLTAIEEEQVQWNKNCTERLPYDSQRWNWCYYHCPGDFSSDYSCGLTCGYHYSCARFVEDSAMHYCVENDTLKLEYAAGCEGLRDVVVCLDEDCGADHCQRGCADAFYACQWDEDCYAEMDNFTSFEFDRNHGSADAFLMAFLDEEVVDYCAVRGRGETEGTCTTLFHDYVACYKAECEPDSCIEESCETELDTCYNSEACIEAIMNQTLGYLMDMVPEEDAEDARRRLKEEDSNMFNTDAVDLIGLPALYIRWLYNTRCEEDAEGCDADFQALLDCAVDGCKDEIVEVDSCLGDTCYDEFESCLQTDEKCGDEMSDVVIYYAICAENENITTGVCDSDLSEFGEYTTYPQYLCWSEEGCTNDFKDAISCMILCEAGAEDCIGECAEKVEACYWDEDCWNALVTLAVDLNATESATWFMDDFLDSDPDSVFSGDAYKQYIEATVCADDGVTCNSEFYDVIDCVYEECVYPYVPCQITGCESEILDCFDSDQCREEVGRLLNATNATIWTGAGDDSGGRRLLQLPNPDYDDFFEEFLPWFGSEQERLQWLARAYHVACDPYVGCSIQLYKMLECITENCEQPDDDDDRTDASLQLTTVLVFFATAASLLLW